MSFLERVNDSIMCIKKSNYPFNIGVGNIQPAELEGFGAGDLLVLGPVIRSCGLSHSWVWEEKQ